MTVACVRFELPLLGYLRICVGVVCRCVVRCCTASQMGAATTDDDNDNDDDNVNDD